jgi:hypothetical protein
MTTNLAAKIATSGSQKLILKIDFDKKKLTKVALDCQADHQRLKGWLEQPVIHRYFQSRHQTTVIDAIYTLTWGNEQQSKVTRLKAIEEALSHSPYFESLAFMQILQKGLRKNEAPARLLLRAGLTPLSSQTLLQTLDELMVWRQQLSSSALSPLYQALISIYYLAIVQPMSAIQTAFNFVLLHQTLQKMSFGVIADKILDFYAQHENIVADTLAMCYHARDKRYHQQPWFQLFFEAWTWALDMTEKELQYYCFGSCIKAKAVSLLENKVLNERQYQLLMQLQHEKNTRDKKNLGLSLWYRVLYKGLTKRTQERDFQLLCEQGLISLRGKQSFFLAGIDSCEGT